MLFAQIICKRGTTWTFASGPFLIQRVFYGVLKLQSVIKQNPWDMTTLWWSVVHVKFLLRKPLIAVLINVLSSRFSIIIVKQSYKKVHKLTSEFYQHNRYQGASTVNIEVFFFRNMNASRYFMLFFKCNLYLINMLNELIQSIAYCLILCTSDTWSFVTYLFFYLRPSVNVI